MQNNIPTENTFDVKGLQINPTVLDTAETRYIADVRVNEEPIQWLADSIQQGIETVSYRNTSTMKVGLLYDGKEYSHPDKIEEEKLASISDIFKACSYVAIGARVAQAKGMKTSFDKKNFEYISLLLPVMSYYGRYHDATEAYDIIPDFGEALKTKLKELGCFSNDGMSFIIPDWYPEAMLYFRRFKLMTGYGLPKEVNVDSPACFQLTMEGDKVVGRPGRSVAEVLIATLVSSSKLTDLFGAYRTFYCGISTVRSAIENIGLKALHDLGA